MTKKSVRDCLWEVGRPGAIGPGYYEVVDRLVSLANALERIAEALGVDLDYKT